MAGSTSSKLHASHTHLGCATPAASTTHFMLVKAELQLCLLQAGGPNHFFVPADDVSYKFEL